MKKFIATESRYQARKQAPWAARIARCDGGFIAFESINDYNTWRNQK